MASVCSSSLSTCHKNGSSKNYDLNALMSPVFLAKAATITISLCRLRGDVNKTQSSSRKDRKARGGKGGRQDSCVSCC